MVYRSVFGIGQQVLLADIGDIAALGIFREQMIKGLFLGWPNAFGDRLIPFLAIREDRIDIENDTAEIKDAMAHHFAN